MYLFITIIIISRKATLPVEMEIECKVKDPVLKQVEEMDERMEAMKESLFGKAKNNINSAQDRYKKDYNRKRKLCQVSFIPFSFVIESQL